MIAWLPIPRIQSWPAALIALAFAFTLFVMLTPSVSAHERVRETKLVFHAEHIDFVGAEPPVCDILEFDGPLQGEIIGNSPSAVGKIWASFEQFRCQITGKLEISSASFAGSGPFYGVVDGNVLRFTVTSETSDAPRDLNFSGLINGDRISGQYAIPHTGFVSDWTLFIGGSGFVTRLSNFKDTVLVSPPIAEIKEIQTELADLRQRRSELAAELDHQLEIESAEIIDHWEGAIKELRAEVEQEIVREKRRFELQRLEVTARLGRNRVVGELDKELELVIAQKWSWFDEEAALKIDLMEKDLAGLKITKATQLDRLSRLIQSVQAELNQKLERSGISTDQALDKVEEPAKDTSIDRSKDTSDEKVERAAPIRFESPEAPEKPLVPSKDDEPGQSRGFFFNSESGAIGDFGQSLDPTTLAVLGILITLVATGLQLVKGN